MGTVGGAPPLREERCIAARVDPLGELFCRGKHLSQRTLGRGKDVRWEHLLDHAPSGVSQRCLYSRGRRALHDPSHTLNLTTCPRRAPLRSRHACPIGLRWLTVAPTALAGGKRMRKCRLLVVAILVLCAACGSSSKGTTTPTTAKGPAPVSTTLGAGVTPTTIKLGISLVDFTCIEQFVDSIRVEPAADLPGVHRRHQRARAASTAARSCPSTSRTARSAQRPPMSAVHVVHRGRQGVRGDRRLHRLLRRRADLHRQAAQDACSSRSNLTQAIMDKSPPGLIMLPGTTSRTPATILLTLLKKQGTLDGKTVAVLGETTSREVVNEGIVPDAEEDRREDRHDRDPRRSPDSRHHRGAGAARQLHRAVEDRACRTRCSSPATEVASQAVRGEGAARACPDMTLMTDNGDMLTLRPAGATRRRQAEPLRRAHHRGGLTRPGRTTTAPTGSTARRSTRRRPARSRPTPRRSCPGRTARRSTPTAAINDACQTLSMFHDIAARVGQVPQQRQLGAHRQQLRPDRATGVAVRTRRCTRASTTSTTVPSAPSSTRRSRPTGNWKSVTDLQNIPGS